MASSRLRRLKLVIVGDGGVGKTCLLIAACKNEYPQFYVPTVFENYVHEMTGEDGKTYEIALWDTGGGEDYYRLRPLSYPDTDIFVLCYDISHRWSFDNIEAYWIPELDHFCPHTPRLIVGCKADLRQTCTDDEVVAYSEGVELAKRLDTSFVETSAKELKGMEACFKEALRLALVRSKKPTKRKWFSTSSKRWMKTYEYNDYRIQHPASSKPRPPPIEVQSSALTDHWLEAFNSSLFTDVVFSFEGEHQIQAHKVILCSTSTIFNKLFDDIEPSFLPDDVMDVSEVTLSDGKQHTQITLSRKVSPNNFKHVLNFIYTGSPTFPEDFDEPELDRVVDLCHQFDLADLETFCDNVLAERGSDLNPSLVSYQRERIGHGLKRLFFNQARLSDVVFTCQGKTIYGHRSLLIARSEVLSAMLGGEFKEAKEPRSEINIADADCQSFLGFLEYLYTDQSPQVSGADWLGVLALADRYCEERLRDLAQLALTREVTDAGPGTHVIEMVQAGRLYNAPQLVKWCFHYMSTHYESFENLAEYYDLSEGDRAKIEKSRWPPEWELEDSSKSSRIRAHIKDKCLVM